MMLAMPPSITPSNKARKGSSEVTGPHPRSFANWIGMAAKHLGVVSCRRSIVHIDHLQVQYPVYKGGIESDQKADRSCKESEWRLPEFVGHFFQVDIPFLMSSMQCPVSSLVT
jgi:hypothetical protein